VIVFKRIHTDPVLDPEQPLHVEQSRAPRRCFGELDLSLGPDDESVASRDGADWIRPRSQHALIARRLRDTHEIIQLKLTDASPRLSQSSQNLSAIAEGSSVPLPESNAVPLTIPSTTTSPTYTPSLLSF
jgi:hypothetical protein